MRSLEFLSKKESPILEDLFHSIFKDCTSQIQLKLSQWIMYIEERCAKMEIPISDPPQRGLQFRNISWGLPNSYGPDGLNSSPSYLYLMGLSESALKNKVGTSIELDEVLKIYQDTGYIADFPDNKKIEFQSRWLLDGVFKEAFVSFSSSNFSGSIEGPSRLWLQGTIGQGLNPEKLKYPEPSRWDHIQLSSWEELATLRNWSNKYIQDLKKDLKRNLSDDAFDQNRETQKIPPPE